MISMLWMRYQQLSLACSFATFLILMNFHQLTHLLVRFRLFFIQRFISQVAQPRHETLMHLVYLHYFENVPYPTQPQFPVNLGLTSLVLWWCQVRHEKVELDVKNLTYFLQRHLVQMSYLEKHGASNEHDASTNDPRFWGDKQKIQQVRQILGQAKVSWLQTYIKAMQTKVLCASH